MERDIFGDEDLYDYNDNLGRQFTIICKSSEGTVIKIKKNIYDTKIMCDNSCKEYMAARMACKREKMNNRL